MKTIERTPQVKRRKSANKLHRDSSKRTKKLDGVKLAYKNLYDDIDMKEVERLIKDP